MEGQGEQVPVGAGVEGSAAGTLHGGHDAEVERIAVVGCIGAGKSTVARALGQTIGTEVFHLDRYWWQPGRYRVTGPETVATKTMEPAEYRRLEQQIVAGERWIVDGDAANKDLRLARADTVVFLDLPRWLCLWRLFKRHLKGSYDYPDGVKVPRRREGLLPVDAVPRAVGVDDVAVEEAASPRGRHLRARQHRHGVPPEEPTTGHSFLKAVGAS